MFLPCLLVTLSHWPQVTLPLRLGVLFPKAFPLRGVELEVLRPAGAGTVPAGAGTVGGSSRPSTGLPSQLKVFSCTCDFGLFQCSLFIQTLPKLALTNGPLQVGLVFSLNMCFLSSLNFWMAYAPVNVIQVFQSRIPTMSLRQVNRGWNSLESPG